jgi:predicted Zn-ribbon and HTH transcriptional regulator
MLYCQNLAFLQEKNSTININRDSYHIIIISDEMFKLCKCQRCGYSWNSRKADDNPIECPKCKTTHWREPYKRKSNIKNQLML